MAKTATFKKRGKDYALQDGARTLPGKYYQSQAIFQEELEKVFGGRWILACREEALEAQGSYELIPVGDESLILTRGKDGKLRALFNVCRHRGTGCASSPRGFSTAAASAVLIMPGLTV